MIYTALFIQNKASHLFKEVLIRSCRFRNDSYSIKISNHHLLEDAGNKTYDVMINIWNGDAVKVESFHCKMVIKAPLKTGRKL